MSEFMLGAYATALARDEVLESIEIPQLPAGSRWGWWKVTRKVGEFPDALAGVLSGPSTSCVFARRIERDFFGDRQHVRGRRSAR